MKHSLVCIPLGFGLHPRIFESTRAMPLRGALFLFLIFTFSLVHWSKAQDYTVVAVRGSVKSKKTGKPLRPGDIIPPDDIITFKDKADFATLLTKEGALKYFKYPKKRFRKKKAIYDLPLILQDGAQPFVPVTPIVNSVEIAKAFFASSGFLLFGPDSKIRMDKKVWPFSKAYFFYVNYDYKDDNVDKKLDFKGDTLVFVKKNIFKIDGKEVDGKYAENYKLYYYFQPKNKHTFIGKWKPYFIVDERLKEETDVLVGQLKNLNATDTSIVMGVAGFLATQYGNMIAEDFTQWMKENYPSLLLPVIPKAVAAPIKVDEKAEAKKKKEDEERKARSKDPKLLKKPKLKKK